MYFDELVDLASSFIYFSVNIEQQFNFSNVFGNCFNQLPILPNGSQGHPWLHLPPSPTRYQAESNNVLRAADLFNYRHRLTKMHKAVEAWKQKKIHK